MIITLNEERNIKECLESVFFSNEIIVVDSGSMDRTVSLARSLGARVFEKRFEDFASQKNFGMGQAEGDWILLVDADERVTPALANEIKKTLEEAKAEGVFVIRRNNIFGRWMRFGINRLDWQLRLIKKSSGRFEGLVHERILFSGKAMRLKNPLLHYSTKSISSFMAKLNPYVNLEVKILDERQFVVGEKEMKRRPFEVFCKHYFIKLGFLDGLEGFLFCFLSAYYEFIRLLKKWEIQTKDGGVR